MFKYLKKVYIYIYILIYYKKQKFKKDENLTSKAMQTFILANIARLADSYANLEHSNFKDHYNETK